MEHVRVRQEAAFRMHASSTEFRHDRGVIEAGGFLLKNFVGGEDAAEVLEGFAFDQCDLVDDDFAIAHVDQQLTRRDAFRQIVFTDFEIAGSAGRHAEQTPLQRIADELLVRVEVRSDGADATTLFQNHRLIRTRIRQRAIRESKPHPGAQDEHEGDGDEDNFL